MIRGFVEQITSVGITRMAELVRDGVMSDYYVYVGPDNAAAIANKQLWDQVHQGNVIVPTWGWYVCSADQAADVAAISALDAQLKPAGWCMNIEKVLEGAKLEVLLSGVAALGRPITASLAGSSASHVEFDYRCLDKYGVSCDWQAYFDSGEGPPPADAVGELYASTFVLTNREYRHRLSSAYGWGKITRVEQNQKASIDSYKRPGSPDAHFAVTTRQWGWTVVSRELFRSGKKVGMLMGKATYPNIRVTLDCTRTAQTRPAAEWTPIAASARYPGAAKRGVSVYLVDNASEDVLRAMAKGAA